MVRVLGGLVLVTLLSGATCIDVIDGNWCAVSGDQLSIKGELVTLPSQITLSGVHHMHAFSYWPIQGTRDYGNMVYMHLEDDGQMNVYHVQNGNPGEAEPWKRCDVNS
jgi:hypothetical protein